MQFHPYRTYKPSGINWLGDVPAHWDVRRLKTICGMKSGENITAESIEPSGEYPVYGGNGIRGYALAYTHKGDFVLIGRQGALCGNIHIARRKFWASEHAVIATLDVPNRVEWFAAVLETMNLNQYSISAAQPGLAVERILNLSLPVPPLAEQATIVRYLDDADERIQRAISAKERLIELLTEQRQVVIYRAVMRGLDPNVRLKDSGVAWLGDVPEHWEVRRAKHYYCEVDERSTTGTEELMSVSHITGVTPRKSSVTMFMADNNIGYKICRPGDIAINTMWAYMAALGVVGQEGIVSPSYGVYRPRSASTFIPRYVDPLLRTATYKAEYLRRSTGITSSRLRLYPDQFLSIPLLCPPAAEQFDIVRYLDKATADIDSAIANAERQVDLLGEYRARLIADVVTGRMDVRGEE